jgi:single-strand DNA-binding protein
MSIVATVYGRAAFDPRQHVTKGGKDMTTCRLAVDATGHGAEEQQILWVDVLAFGRNAEALARVEKGQMVSAMGKVTLSHFTGKDGTDREQLSLLADSIVTARSGRPGGRKPKGNHQKQPDGEVPFDDAIVF